VSPRKKPRGPKVPKTTNGMVGDSSAIHEVHRLIRCYSKVRLPALIRGETGTGKELVAKALHDAGARKAGPFVVVSAPNLPANLVESELFGHRRGAFTGAGEAKEGSFMAANGGTLFIDEIGDMPLDVQVKILRAVQERKVRRVGDTREHSVDVRVVAATNRDLEAMIEQRTFREDLYHRLAYCNLNLPPLRGRGNDPLLLARFFMHRGHAKEGLPRRSLGQDCKDLLLAHTWPGNVRELEGAIYRALAVGTGPSVRRADMEQALQLKPCLEAVEPCIATTPPLLAALEGRASLSAAELRAALGVSKTDLGRRIKPWLASGRVIRDGAGPATRYRLAATTAVANTDPRWDAVLALCHDGQAISRSKVATTLGVCDRSATRILRAMVSAHLLVETGGKGRSAGYRSAPRPLGQQADLPTPRRTTSWTAQPPSGGADKAATG